MKQKLIGIEAGCDIRQIEAAFRNKKVHGPVIRFVKYIPKSRMDVYSDEITGKNVMVSTIKNIVRTCPVCKKREKRFRALKRYVLPSKGNSNAMEEWYKVRDEYVVKRECPDCGNRLGSIMSDSEFKTHTHSCNRCNTHFPENPEEVYNGEYVDDTLNYPHGEF